MTTNTCWTPSPIGAFRLPARSAVPGTATGLALGFGAAIGKPGLSAAIRPRAAAALEQLESMTGLPIGNDELSTTEYDDTPGLVPLRVPPS